MGKNNTTDKIKYMAMVLLLLTGISNSDMPPTITFDVDPSNAAPGESVTLTANAQDDAGVQRIYFYKPPSPDIIAEECEGSPQTCTKSVSLVADTVGTNTYCAKAMDTSNQLSDLSCLTVAVSSDKPPVINHFYADPKGDENPTVHIGGTVKFNILASDDLGLNTVYFEDVATGSVESSSCGRQKTCIFETKRMFTEEGVYGFCAWALDTSGKESGKACIDVHSLSKETCELIKLEDADIESVLALKLTSRRLRMDRDGLIGYSATCCKDYGFCEDLEIEISSCERMGGSLPDGGYIVVNYDARSTSIESLLPEEMYPEIVCTAVNGDTTTVGIINNYNYQPVGQTENLEENLMTYWLMGEMRTGPVENDRILVYTSGGFEADTGPLKSFLEDEGYSVDVIERTKKITKDLLADYGQVWLMETTGSTHLDQSEIDAVIDYYNNGGNLLLSGEGDTGDGINPPKKNAYIDMVNDISLELDVSFSSPLTLDYFTGDCITLSYTSHPVTEGLSTLGSTGSDALITSLNPGAETIAAYGDGNPAIMIADASGGKGRIVFDSSFMRFMSTIPAGLGPCGPSHCSNSQLISNVANWLGEMSDASGGGTPGAARYFFAEQLQQEDDEAKVSTIVDSEAYSNVINQLMEEECLQKDLESTECHFDCLEAECNPTAPCGSGNCLGCPKPPTCECCPQCHKLLDYEECTYRKYKEMYGRPYVDYLFCWKVPGLKDTPWCYQKSDQPTSSIDYPWYAFTRKEDGYYRSLDSIDDEYISMIHQWNINAEVNEKPASTDISEKQWVPEVYCDHNFDDKLLRNIWTKVFTATPFLYDLRNNMTWTKTGPGTLYAGGGFRREPACWWECCRRCAPYCDCACAQGCSGQICCLSAQFSPPSVNNLIEITIPDTTVSEGGMQITYNDDKTVATLDNGAIKLISTGNMPFTVSGSFSKDEPKGLYGLALVYTPIGGFSGNKNHNPSYDQFVIAQDIILNYNLNEDAKDLVPGIKETFSTTLIDRVCKCTPKIKTCSTCAPICPPGCGEGSDCCCCPTETKTITTEESVQDSRGSQVLLDTIKIDALRIAANNFVDIAISSGINVGLVGFSSSGYAPSCPGGICSSHPLTTEAGPLHEQINKYKPLHGTCIACGIEKGVQLISGANGEKHLIVMSDGVPQCCAPGGGMCGEASAKSQALSSAGKAKGAGIIIHTVALGNDADRPFMEQLAEAGGGKYYDVTCECPLECIYEELAQEVVKDNAVLVNDVTGSMSLEIDLDCPGEGTPIIHKFGVIDLKITGKIDNYMDEDISTGVRSEGTLVIEANPDIVNRFVYNAGESTIDYYSLFYTVKHESYRKEYAHGQWLPGYPYAVGEQHIYEPSEGRRTYVFGDAYGYESEKFDYPEQCRQICPSDCTCPDDNIMDVTCTDKSGNKYKRTDCVCLPPRGHSFESPCTSQRTFHEEEGYYFDFVDLETKEIAGDIDLMGQKGTNPQFTGNLKGDVKHEITQVEGTQPAGCQEKTPEKWSLAENTVILPTDPADAGAGDSQKEPLAVHGLAWYIADCAKDPSGYGLDSDAGIKIGRIIGPADIAGVKYNAGPYVVLSEDVNPLTIVKAVMDKKPEFNEVNYYVLNSKADAEAIEIMPAVICISDGAYDQPSQLFDEMHMPYIPWDDTCMDKADVLIFGCPQGPLNSVSVDEVRKFVSECGVYIGTDLSYSYGGFEQIFPGYFNGEGSGSGTATIWEGGVKGSYDLPSDLRRFFQTPYETTSGWQLMAGTIVINDVSNPDTKVLAKGDYSMGGTDKPTAVTFKYGNGRVFYYPVHVEGAVAASNKAFMSSFYLSASSSSGKAASKENKTGTYVLDFEAMNFPYSLIEYNNDKWVDSGVGESCYDTCAKQNMIAVAECESPTQPPSKNCVYCGVTEDAGFYVRNCKSRCSDTEHIEQKCCCASPSFKTSGGNVTVYIHFRDNLEDQTFDLFPARKETKPYANIEIDVKVRNPSKLLCEAEPLSAEPGNEVTVYVTLLDPLTGKGMPSREVMISLDAYAGSGKVSTDANGKAEFKFTTNEQSTGISCRYAGESDYTPSSDKAYVNVYSMDRFWWFISPQALLMILILILLAFSYRWFRGGGLDFQSMWDEIRGKK